ncbi:MAG: CoA transferase [Pseudomonadota bacterium]
MTALLKGMRVVEGSAFVAVPLAGMSLAQMGADVIRFDRIGGGLDWKRWPVTHDGRSLFWAGLNKGKRSIAIDMKSERGKELVTEIITAPGEDAGLFLTNLRVRGWMDQETLSQRRADLISVVLTGDRRGRPQVDYTVNPALGFPDATGPEGSPDPVAHVLPAWDCIAGGLVVQALLAAERHRLRTGEGQGVEVALKDVAAAMLGHLGIVAEVAVNGVDRAKGGNALYGAYGQDFPCRDGRRVMVIGLTDRQWRGLVKITGKEAEIAALSERLAIDLRDEGQRWHARAEITEILKPWFAQRRVEEFAADFDAAGLTWSEFRSFARAVQEDPDLSPANPMYAMIDQPGIGAFPAPSTPLNFGAAEREPPRRAPLLGEHSEAILADVVGLSAAQIGRLMDDGVTAGP